MIHKCELSLCRKQTGSYPDEVGRQSYIELIYCSNKGRYQKRLFKLPNENSKHIDRMARRLVSTKGQGAIPIYTYIKRKLQERVASRKNTNMMVTVPKIKSKRIHHIVKQMVHNMQITKL